MLRACEKIRHPDKLRFKHERPSKDAHQFSSMNRKDSNSKIGQVEEMLKEIEAFHAQALKNSIIWNMHLQIAGY